MPTLGPPSSPLLVAAHTCSAPSVPYAVVERVPVSEILQPLTTVPMVMNRNSIMHLRVGQRSSATGRQHVRDHTSQSSQQSAFAGVLRLRTMTKHRKRKTKAS